MEGFTSIIVPARNEAADFEARLRALTSQLDERFGDRYELIVVDDGSTNDTCQTLRNMRRTHPRFVLEEHEQSVGFKAAIQSGIRMSTGDQVIVFRSGLRRAFIAQTLSILSNLFAS